MSRFTVTFNGDPPDDVRVGDKLVISGEVTVRSITADLVDVTRYGSDPEFLLGEVAFDLHANRLEVGPALAPAQGGAS